MRLSLLLVLMWALGATTELLKLDDCYQSSTDWAGDCHRAIDGNTNQNYGQSSCSHTKSEVSWWQGSMKKRALIKEIKVFNRLDCCSERLNNFVVIVDNQTCGTYNSDTFFSVMTFQCNKEGQNVIIKSQLALPLTLCEVQVFGEYVKEPAMRSDKLPLSNCSQSSLELNGVCTRAIDNNTNQFYFGLSCTHTKSEMGWWMASTDKLANIKEIQIYNRVDCCSDRLTNFVVTVDGQECVTYSGAAFKVQTFKCDKVGQVVIIRSKISTLLTLCEVNVFGKYVRKPLSGELLKLDNCYQSSTDVSGDCHRAIDGNTNQNYWQSSCSHTKSEVSLWQGSMKKRALIKRIKIFNRLDCCSERLNSFVVMVDDQTCGTYKSDTFFSVMTFQCNKEGQNVIIKSQLALALTLCEVQVFGEYVKEPAMRSDQLILTNCSQSSLDGNGACDRAIDGNSNQFYNGQSCTLTRSENGWWKASTEKKSEIREVKIFNRMDCCSDRLNNFVITVDGQECASYNSTRAFSVKAFKCCKVGQVVEIRSRKTTILTLCEVEVFGHVVRPTVRNFVHRPKFKFLGCYEDIADSRDLPALAASEEMSPKKCNSLCATRGTVYFALQNGTQCWCGDDYGSCGEVNENECQMNCSGDSVEKCGGNLRNAVFDVDKSLA